MQNVTCSDRPSGTRSLGASRLEDFFEDPDNCNEELADGETSATEEESSLKDFATSRRRAKERANEAFERDLEELRKRRRDMQDKMFDMIDMNAEMQIAKSCLEGANRAFMKHATKFDNSENQLDRQVVEQRGPTSEKSHQDRGIVEAERDSRAHRAPAFRWTRMEEIERDPAGLISGISNRRARIDSIPGDDVIAEEDEEQAVPRERTKRRPSFLKRKKSVSF